MLSGELADHFGRFAAQDGVGGDEVVHIGPPLSGCRCRCRSDRRYSQFGDLVRHRFLLLNDPVPAYRFVIFCKSLLILTCGQSDKMFECPVRKARRSTRPSSVADAHHFALTSAAPAGLARSQRGLQPAAPGAPRLRADISSPSGACTFSARASARSARSAPAAR
jgi:hypothetical protein